MTLVMSNLYIALRAAGASEESVRKAADVAGYERLAKVRRDIGTIKWMLAVNLAMTTAMVVKLFA